ncbi:fibroblast growth factor-binding protein 3 [Alligator mississippiensis]|uniref:fibroblast growth factor-binding protein 3 n=1 Tax=Alligator mississippiensis TaxID=8496 RepID=UPI0028780C59|nr:fibroblast growth factor-binding protein 3 [Alligator mississippiensis]
MRLPVALALAVLGALGAAAAGAGEAAAGWARSGQFSTREQHLCSWRLLPAPGATELRLSCQAAAGPAQQCAYRGQPERCAAYAAKGRQYWKQILGKLRRKRHPCQDRSPLRARLCAAKQGPHEAQLHLLPASPGPGPGPSAAAPAPGQPRAKEPAEKRGRAGKRKARPGATAAPGGQRPSAAADGSEPPTGLSEDLAATYCSENWHSLCSFLVNFWHG